MAGRPETPPSYVVDLDKIVNMIYERGKTEMAEFPWSRLDMDVVVPVYESLPEDIAKRTMWISDNKIYVSTKSSYVDYLLVERGKDRFYIYDKFKSNGTSHKNSYKQLTYEVPYADDSAEPIYLPVYWRVN